MLTRDKMSLLRAASLRTARETAHGLNDRKQKGWVEAGILPLNYSRIINDLNGLQKSRTASCTALAQLYQRLPADRAGIFKPKDSKTVASIVVPFGNAGIILSIRPLSGGRTMKSGTSFRDDRWNPDNVAYVTLSVEGMRHQIQQVFIEHQMRVSEAVSTQLEKQVKDLPLLLDKLVREEISHIIRHEVRRQLNDKVADGFQKRMEQVDNKVTAVLDEVFELPKATA
jgi:hypothetical protein